MTDTPPTDPPAQPQVQPPAQTPPAPQQDQSAAYWQSQYDKQQQSLQGLHQTVQQLQQQISAPPQPPQNTPPQNPKQQLDFNNWNSWKGEDGSYKQEYVDSVFHPDLPQEVRNTLLNTIDATNTYTQQQMQQQVNEKFGSKENLDAAMAWAQTGLPEYERNSLNAALQNPALAPMALQTLRDKAEAGGAFEQQPQTNEPAPIPQGSVNHVGETPLVPGSPEAIEAIQDPRYGKDKTYTETTARRIRSGSTGNPNFPSRI